MSTLAEVKRQIPAFEEKVQLKIYIDKGLSNRFREMISQKYGKYKGGLLSYEVEEALRRYIAAHASITQIAHGSNPTPKIFKLKEKIKRYLIENYSYKMTNQVLIVHFRDAVAQIIGADERTYEKYIKIFKQQGILKVLGPNQVELI